MSAPRNFRKILDVDPQSPHFHCVGETKKGGRCRQSFFSGDDRAEAGALLTKMDSKSLKSSYRYLDDLAFLTLCPRWHRKPGYSQVTSVSQRWRLMIQQYEAEEAYLEWSTTVKVEQSLPGRKAAAQRMQVKVKEERPDKIPAISLDSKVLERNSKMMRPSQKNSSSVTNTKEVDPFVSRSTSTQTIIPETPFTQLLKASRTRDSDSYRSNSALHGSAANKAKLDKPSTPSTQASNLPSPPSSPPTTPLVSRGKRLQETEEPILAKAESTKPGNDSPKPFKLDIHPKTSTPKRGFKQLPLGPPELEFLRSTVPNYRPETPKTTPKSKTHRVGGFEFGSQYRVPPKTFEFKSPLQPSFAIRLPEKPSTIWDDINKEKTKDLPETIPVSPQTPVESPIPTTETTIPANEAPQTPVRAPEQESFGTAIITSSTSSRIYLPATQQYGLMTPPDEPDTWDPPRIKFRSPIAGKDDFASPSPEVPHPTPPTVPRKPVDAPSKNAAVQDSSTQGGGSEKVTFAACGHLSPPNGQDCPCAEEPVHEDIQTGCLHGMRRLRKMVVRKVEYLGARSPWSKAKVKAAG